MKKDDGGVADYIRYAMKGYLKNKPMNTKGKTGTWEKKISNKAYEILCAYDENRSYGIPEIIELCSTVYQQGQQETEERLGKGTKARVWYQKGYQQGRVEAIEEVKRLRTWSETEKGMERSLDHTGEFILIKDIDSLQSTREKKG